MDWSAQIFPSSIVRISVKVLFRIFCQASVLYMVLVVFIIGYIDWHCTATNLIRTRYVSIPPVVPMLPALQWRALQELGEKISKLNNVSIVRLILLLIMSTLGAHHPPSYCLYTLHEYYCTCHRCSILNANHHDWYQANFNRPKRVMVMDDDIGIVHRMRPYYLFLQEKWPNKPPLVECQENTAVLCHWGCVRSSHAFTEFFKNCWARLD